MCGGELEVVPVKMGRPRIVGHHLQRLRVVARKSTVETLERASGGSGAENFASQILEDWARRNLDRVWTMAGRNGRRP